MSWIQRLFGSQPQAVVEAEFDFEDFSAMTVHPRQPFIDWLNSCASPGEPKQTVKGLRAAGDQSVYLIPSYEGSWDAEPLLERAYAEVFSRELEGWYLNPTCWPQKRDLATFKAWFEVVWHSAVVDLR
jgi:hypothetical protein